LVTGGAGFIGSNFVLDWLAGSSETVRQPGQVDLRGQPAKLRLLSPTTRLHVFVHGDIGDAELINRLLQRTPASGSAELCGRKPRRPLHSWSG